MSWGYSFRPYVPVAQRRAKAATYAARLAKKEKRTLCPVKIQGRKIVTSFWGQSWCDHLEAYSDFANRLPRGRTYVRNGSVIDLQISRGNVKAIVSGSDLYHVEVKIGVLKKTLWTRLKGECSHAIDSLLDLLQGRFDDGVMRRLSQPKDGLFPLPNEINMRCSCRDWAGLCKHVAATLYGVGARLDAEPALLFALRGVDHRELINQAVGTTNLDAALGGIAVRAACRHRFGGSIRNRNRRWERWRLGGYSIADAPKESHQHEANIACPRIGGKKAAQNACSNKQRGSPIGRHRLSRQKSERKTQDHQWR